MAPSFENLESNGYDENESEEEIDFSGVSSSLLLPHPAPC